MVLLEELTGLCLARALPGTMGWPMLRGNR